MDEIVKAVPVDSERLQEFEKILRKYKAGKASLESRVVASEQWWKLRNETEARKQGVAWDEDFYSKSGWLHNVLVSKHADAMENYPEAMILPREQMDKAQAKMLSSVIPCILEQNDFEQTYSDCWWQKLKQGTAVYKITWDADKLNGLGDISIQKADLLMLFWEPGITDIQKSRYLFHCELQDNDLLEEQFPELKDKLKGNTVTLTKYLYDDNVSTEGKTVVVDVYYKKNENGRQVLHYCKYVGDTVLFSTENDQAGETGVITSDETQEPYMDDQDIQTEVPEIQPAAPEIQHYGLYDDGMYPFVFDPLFPVEGSPCGYGYVDLCQNSQIAIDIMRTAFIKNVKTGATPRYFYRTDGSINEEEFQDLRRALVHVNGSLDDTFVKPINNNSLPGNYLGVYESMITELRETSGNTESANGIYSGGVTAASSIAALQEASGKTSRDASKASYRAYHKMISMVIERIRQFYDLPRQFRITGEYGEEQYVTFDNSMLQPQVQGIDQTDMGYRLPVFDIRVEVQKRNAYTRTSQNELALQLYQLGVFNPAMAEQSMTLLDMMDFDGKEAILQKLQQTVMMQQMMMGMVPQPVVGGPPAQLEEPTDTGEKPIVSKARDRANQAASV